MYAQCIHSCESKYKKYAQCTTVSCIRTHGDDKNVCSSTIKSCDFLCKIAIQHALSKKCNLQSPSVSSFFFSGTIAERYVQKQACVKIIAHKMLV